MKRLALLGVLVAAIGVGGAARADETPIVLHNWYAEAPSATLKVGELSIPLPVTWACGDAAPCPAPVGTAYHHQPGAPLLASLTTRRGSTLRFQLGSQVDQLTLAVEPSRSPGSSFYKLLNQAQEVPWAVPAFGRAHFVITAWSKVLDTEWIYSGDFAIRAFMRRAGRALPDDQTR